MHKMKNFVLNDGDVFVEMCKLQDIRAFYLDTIDLYHAILLKMLIYCT